MTKLLTLYSPNSCNSFFFLTPLPTTPHTSFPLPASSLSGICTCCSPAMTCCPWRTGFSTRRLTHCQSSTWETSPCPAASPLSGKRAGTFFVHHGTRGLFACLPRKTHPRTPDKLTIQTLNWFLRPSTRGVGRDHYRARGPVTLLALLLCFTLWLCRSVFSAQILRMVGVLLSLVFGLNRLFLLKDRAPNQRRD